ncbi:hypothetical protein CATMIT_00007 [Catenibacterium mitsuokai DSM 15897]|nr:hypothetical protein CATMIT_00007 [Catenibacterium mitsuokai DSM 15897]
MYFWSHSIIPPSLSYYNEIGHIFNKKKKYSMYFLVSILL